MVYAAQSCSCSYQDPGPSLSSSPIGDGFLMFMSILEVYINGRCDIAQPCERVVGENKIDQLYDFIVVGGGSAGAIVAGRLSEDSRFKVLLLEAGGVDPVTSRVPTFHRSFLNNPHTDWMYRTVPDNFCLSENRRGCMWPRGKVLGGSSVLNGMMYHRGHPADYEDWVNSGAEGWSWDEVLPFIEMSEDNKEIGTVVKGEYHSTGGPMPIQRFRYQPPFVHKFLAAIKEAGLPVIDDMADLNTPEGMTVAQTFNDDGQRFTTARAYLKPKSERPNLDVILNAHVTKLLINNSEVYGVEFERNGERRNVYAGKEVILSAGALNTPHIMLLSGIGPKAELDAFNIPVVADLPVGKNLRNHYGFTMFFTLENEKNTQTLDCRPAAATEYLLNKDGPLSATGIAQMTGLLYSSLADRERKQPDLQFFFGGYNFAECFEIGEINEPVGDSYNQGRNVSVTVVSLLPRSEGVLTLNSTDPFDPPLFYPGFFTNPDDMLMLKDGARYLQSIVETEILKNEYGIKLDRSFSACDSAGEEWSDEWIECITRYYTDPQNHQLGTAAIGRVIDTELNVYNVTGLRVIDASSMPSAPTGNPQGVIMMVAERGAHFIKRKWAS